MLRLGPLEKYYTKAPRTSVEHDRSLAAAAAIEAWTVYYENRPRRAARSRASVARCVALHYAGRQAAMSRTERRERGAAITRRGAYA